MAQFTLYSHAAGPNGWKVAIVLNALGLTYDTIYLDFAKGEHKKTPYTDLNPNGRVPTLIDHQNGDFTIWESGAIVLYLINTYDAEEKFSVSSPKERSILIQYLFFQASGQGPYFGQAYHFLKSAPESLDYPVKRYRAEIERVLSVLESILSKQQYLVGGKVTVADLSFITWNNIAFGILRHEDEESLDMKFPSVARWHKELCELPFVVRTVAEKASLA